MPVSVKKQGDKYRVVEEDGSIAKNAAGTSVDGGGHDTRRAAIAQVTAINLSERRKR